jgi:hypothetical protein
MWRRLLPPIGFCLVLGALLYGYGHPSLEGYRPAVFAQPLQGFHQEVDKAAFETSRMLATLNDMRGHYFRRYVESVKRQVNGGSSASQ